MDWRKKLYGLPGKITKEGWIVLLCLGLIMMVVAMPLSGKDGGKKGGVSTDRESLNKTGAADLAGSSKAQGEEGMGGGDSLISYEAALENRVKEVLKKVEGVGAVDVLIVLKSSEERVYRTDGKHSQSSTKELDSAGGSREVTEHQEEVSTVLSSGGGNLSGNGGSGALLEKELCPELSGIIISAQGGGSPTVKAEITEAMEALFGLPAHKIKVLKRVE